MADRLRLPAYPLLTSDPYLSVWLCADSPAGNDTRHWTGERKRLEISVSVDGMDYALLGNAKGEAAVCEGIAVTPTTTILACKAAGLQIEVSFTAPLLLDDWDLLSIPVTFVNIAARAEDGAAHDMRARLVWHDDICYRGSTPPDMVGETLVDRGVAIGYMGRKEQKLLCHSGDHVSIDWGYAYLAADGGITFAPLGDHHALVWEASAAVGTGEASLDLLMAYDDVASVQYFGHTA